MICFCSKCCAPFDAEEINRAIKEKKSVVQCKFCSNTTEINVKSSSIAKGYEALEKSKFNEAVGHFAQAIENSAPFKPAPDAYIGAALAQYNVQTVFKEDNYDNPQLICHTDNSTYKAFCDSEMFKKALDAIPNADLEKERQRLYDFARTIDTVTKNYSDIKREKGDDFYYGAFIVCGEAVNKDNFLLANKIGNLLPRDKYTVFLQEPYELRGNSEADKLFYDAEILFAIDRSKCMLVISDDNIDLRRRSIYSRYFKSKGEKGIAFIANTWDSPIILPDGKRAENLFKFDDTHAVISFVAKLNGRLDVGGSVLITEQEEEVAAVEDDEKTKICDDNKFGLPVIDGNSVTFGSYPQREEKNEEILAFFNSFDKPNLRDNTDWRILFRNKTGKPYAWYRDEEYKGKKYRAVYYLRLRKAFTLQNSDREGAQRANRYENTGRIYCFEFQPIVWEIAKKTLKWTALISGVGLDSREYNCKISDSEWEMSSLYEWLNTEFIETAFNETQAEWLCGIYGYGEDCRVFIPDADDDKDFCRAEGAQKGITDYFKCVGGGLATSGGVNSYWVTDKNNERYDEAKVIDPNIRGITTQYVDCTMVAVVPKIVVKL